LAFEIEEYRKEKSKNLAKNDAEIADCKAKFKSDKKEAKEEYFKKVAELERKNDELKSKIANYNQDNKISWDKFRDEFNHDMSELGKSFKDFTVENK